MSRKAPLPPTWQRGLKWRLAIHEPSSTAMASDHPRPSASRLRSLYFLLAGMLPRFAYLKLGVAALLVFAGDKILLSGVWKMPVWLSLAIIVGIIGVSVGASLWRTRGGRGTKPGLPERRAA